MKIPRNRAGIVVSILLILLLIFGGTSVYAAEYIDVNSDENVPLTTGGTYKFTGTTATKNIEITASTGDFIIYLKDVDIDVSDTAGKAAFKIKNNTNANVTVILEGENTLKGGEKAAGLQKSGDSGSGNLLIKGDGKLNAYGGSGAAGVGSGYNSDLKNLTIENTNINATGGSGAAGIGTGQRGNLKGDLKITDSTIQALGGSGGAGIGTGYYESSYKEKQEAIIISGGNITATGGEPDSENSLPHGGPGIGSTIKKGSLKGIEIKNGAVVTATGKKDAAGIGTGFYNKGLTEDYETHLTDILIDHATITATGGASGIGGGKSSSINSITIRNSNIIKAESTEFGAGIGNGGATYFDQMIRDITIEDSTIQSAKGSGGGAGIGGGKGGDSYNARNVRNIVIKNSDIISEGSKGAAGIGSGSGGNVTSINIYDSNITATTTTIDTNGHGGAGIGSGYDGNVGTITINNPNIEKIIKAIGSGTGAGIGSGGGHRNNLTGDVKSIVIENGTIIAQGGDDNGPEKSGPGIGTGSNGRLHDGITINDGDITATGGTGSAGIGSGYSTSSSYVEYGQVRNVNINGGKIVAKGGKDGPGIGAGANGEYSDINITGGDVTAIGDGDASGIGGGKGVKLHVKDEYSGDISITGGKVNATAGEESNKAIGKGNGSKAEINGDTKVFANKPSEGVTLTEGLYTYGEKDEDGKVGSIKGNITLDEDLTVPGDDGEFVVEEGATLTIPEEKTLTIPDGVTLKVDGDVSNNGTIVVQNGGDIENKENIDNNDEAGEIIMTVSFEELIADGTPDEVTTTILTLTFNNDIDELSVDNITISNGDKGELTSKGNGVYELEVNNLTLKQGDDIIVTIGEIGGYNITPASKSVAVNKKAIDVVFSNLIQNGEDGVEDTTELTVTLDKKVEGLTGDDITVIGATKGEVNIDEAGTTITIKISDIVNNGDTVTVKLAKAGYKFAPESKDIQVFKDTRIPVVYTSVENVDGVDGTEETTELKITLDTEVALAKENIEISESKGTVTSVTSNGDKTYKVEIALAENMNNGDTISVKLAKDGYTFDTDTKSTTVYKDTRTYVEYQKLEIADGEDGVEDTTELTVTLDKEVEGLTPDDITVIGATKGEVNIDEAGTTITIKISDIENNGDTVTVELAKENVVFTPDNRNVTVYKEIPIEKVTITFDMGGKSEDKTEEVIKDQPFSAPMVDEIAGYILEGWYKEETFENKWNFITDSASVDTTLYAKWEADKTSLEDAITAAEATKVQSSEDGTDIPENEEWTTAEELTAFENAIAKAKAIKEKEGATEDEISAAIASLNTAKTVYEESKKRGLKEESGEIEPDDPTEEFTVRLNPNGGKIHQGFIKTVDGKISKLPVPVKSGYDFIGWFDRSGNRYDVGAQISEDMTLYANWKAKATPKPRPSSSKRKKKHRTTVETAPVVVKQIPLKASVPEKKALPFTDVPADAFFRDAVEWAVEKGITTGTTETAFSPYAPTTRGQMITFLWRAAGKPEPTITELPFIDVDPETYYYKPILWAYEQGIAKGYSDTEFAPDEEVTRGQGVTFLQRVSGETGEKENPFTDVKPGAYYEGAVSWANDRGITKGTSETTFSPDKSVTRGEMVTFIYRYYTK